MKFQNVGDQAGRHFLYDASGTLTLGGTPQLVLPEQPSRSYLFFQNISTDLLRVEFGSARATCGLTSGAVTSVTVTNAGFNFTRPPVIRFEGGGGLLNGQYVGVAAPNGPSPSRPAKAHAVLTGGASGGGSYVSSIVIDDPGAGYVIAPFVAIFNSDLDPYGVAAPSATSGMILAGSGAAPIVFNGFTCPTNSIAVYGATTGDAFTCKFMT